MGTDIPQIRRQPLAVGEHLDGIDHLLSRFLTSGIVMQRCALTLDTPKAALGHRMVQAIALAAREGVTDQETRQPGWIVEVTDLTWLTEGDVDVTDGYYEAPMRAAETLCHVVREGNRWTVKHVRVIWSV